MELGLKDKVAVVAGGSRGCGRGISEALAGEGAKVVLSGRNAEAVHATVEAIRAGGGTAVGVVADMTAKAGAQQIIAAAAGAGFGTPDENRGLVPQDAAGRTLGPARRDGRTRGLPVFAAGRFHHRRNHTHRRRVHQEPVLSC